MLSLTPPGDRLAVQHGRRDGPADLAQPGQPRKPNQFPARPAVDVDGAMVVHMELSALAVELGLGDVARVRESARQPPAERQRFTSPGR